jgi:hypothetical protein
MTRSSTYCKHSYAVKLFTCEHESDMEVNKFCLHLHHREKSNLPRLRNQVLYDGVPEKVVVAHLKAGGVSSCGYRGKTEYDLDTTAFPEAPNVFIRVDMSTLLNHCLIGISSNCPVHFFVTGYKQFDSAAFLLDVGLIFEDGIRTEGYVKAHDILTFPDGEECFPLIESPSGEVLALIRALQPAESRRERTPAFDLAATRLPGNGRACKRKQRNVIDTSFPNDIRLHNFENNSTQEQTHKPSSC